METKKITIKKLSLLFILVMLNFSLFSQTDIKNDAAPCTVAVKEHILIKQIFLYPNPVLNTLHIICNDENKSFPFTFTISDLSGKEIIKGSYTKNKSIDVSFLKSGIYFLKASDKENKIYLNKFLKL